MWRKTILATAIVGVGLTSATGAAFAGEDPGHDSADTSSHHDGQDGWGKHHDGHGKHHDGHGKRHDGHQGHDGHGKHGSCDNDVAAKNGDGYTKQTGLLNVSDVQTIAPINLCGNDVPVNVLGIQAVLQDISGNAPVGSSADHGSSNSASDLG